MLWQVDGSWNLSLTCAADVQEMYLFAQMIREVLCDFFAHVDTGGLSTENTDLEDLGVHQAHWRRAER